MRTPFLIAAMLCVAIAAPAAAQETKVGPDRYAVTVHRADLHPATPSAAQRTLSRIEAAALAVCGGSDSSLGAMKLAVRHSACWRDSMVGAMAGVDDPLLLQAYHRHS